MGRFEAERYFGLKSSYFLNYYRKVLMILESLKILISNTTHSINPSFFAAFASAIAACISAYVACQQYTINKYRLKFDLYERRLNIFSAVIKFMVSVRNHPSLLDPEAFYDARLIELDLNTRDATFLFDENTCKYIKKIRKESLDILTIGHSLAEKDLSQHDRDIHAEKKAKKLIWLTNQLEESQNEFRKYLNLGILK
ncbi:hypothetical protein [Picosynechococcus sp. NKBG042902]|uniref:hypothetical protein n=2 Tax=Picosynechococcus sp. NKBG042902 TaxID=490193 RepID=UPI001267EB66